MSGNVLLFLFTISLLNNCKGSNISDKRLCYDPKCSVAISLAKGLVTYVRNHHEGLSFQPGDEITIFSKSAGSRQDLWGAEMGGKRGYVPKDMVREFKVYHPENTLKHTVSTGLPNESKRKEAIINDQKKENAEATQHKQDDVKISESNIQSEASNTMYDVIEGTTIFSDPLLLATSTVNSLETDSKEMGAVPVEATASFTTTTGDMNTQSLVHSEMSPISATTMIEKPETSETSIETSEIPSELDSGNVVESMIGFVSDFVSGKGEDNLEKSVVHNFETEINEKDLELHTDKLGDGEKIDKYDSMGSENTAGDGVEGEEKKKQDSLHEEIGDGKEKSDEEEEDEDEGEDDEEGEYEEEGDDYSDEEEDGEVINEGTIDERNDAILADENKANDIQEDSKSAKLSDSMSPEFLNGNADSTKVSEESSAVIGNSSDLSQLDSLDVAEKNRDYISTISTESVKDITNEKGVDAEEHVEKFSAGVIPGNSQSENEADPSLMEMHNLVKREEPSFEKENVVNPLSTEGFNVEKLVKENSIGDHSKLQSYDNPISRDNISIPVSDGISIKTEIPEGAERVIGSLDKGEFVAPLNYDKKEETLHQHVLQDTRDDSSGKESMATNEAYLEVHTTTTESLSYSLDPETENSAALNSGDDDLKLNIFKSIPTSSSNALYMEQTTPSAITSDGTLPKPDNLLTDPSYIAANENSSYQEEHRMVSLESTKHEEIIQTDVDQLSVVHDEKPKVEITEILQDSYQKKENVGETPNVSDGTDQLLVSEDSFGFFSTLLGFLKSGYVFMTDMVLGQNEELIEGAKSASLETPEMIADKYGDSEGIQHQSTGNEGQVPVGGNTFFGSSSNSQCDADPTDSLCENLSGILPFVSENSNDVEDQNSDEDPESTNWMGFLNFSIGNYYSGMIDIHVPSYGALIYPIITGVMVLCFFLGHYFIEGKRRDVLLLAKINSLEKELTVSCKECLILKERLKNSESKSSSFDDSTEVINSIKSELEKVQNEKAQLEKELEATTEAGLEMELMVSQFLSSQHDSKSLMESIEQLQMQANKQQAKISTLENSLISKTQENEKLAQELSLTEHKVQELEEDLKQVSENLNERDDEHTKRYDELKELSDSHRKKCEEDVKNKAIEAEMALTRCKSLEISLTEMKDTLAVKDNEISVLQECLQQLKLSNGDNPDKAAEQLKNMLDFGKLKAELIAVVKERNGLKEELQGEEDARKLLEDHVKVIREEVEKLRKCHEAAEREKIEAQTRLEVLSSYFKEKETQLQKELGIQEAMWVQKHTDASTIMQRMKSLEEEVENYRSQNETLKKEILDQERGYKTQLATFEKKAHENWVAARQAERKLDESKQESSQLRNRLTMVDKSNANSASQNGDDSKPSISMMDSNGELSASPLHLGLASNSSVDMLLSEPHPLFLDPNSSPPHVGGGGRLPPPPLLPPPPFPPLPPLPPRSPYHHPLSPPLPFMPPPPDAALYPSAMDGHRPPPLGRMSSPPPRPSPSHSPHLPPTESRGGEFPSPYRDRGGGGRSSSPPPGMYRGMPLDDRGLGDEWGVGRYRTPPPHSNHPPEFPIPPYPHPRPHWEDEPPHLTTSFRPLPSQRDPLREHKGGRSKGSHSNESDTIEKTSRHGGKL